MTVKEYAKLHGVTPRRVQKLIKDGRLQAKIILNYYNHQPCYIIDKDTIYPSDPRHTIFNIYCSK